jgi:glycosyltransferase involved in cell wall biosynthesis
MKILLMCHNLTGGGAERVCTSWANGLARLGHDVAILADLQTETMYPVDSHVRLIQLRQTTSSNRIVRRVQRFAFMFRQIRELCQSEQYDAIVNVLFFNWLELRFATWSLRRRIPIVMTDHNACELPPYVPMPMASKMKKFVWSRLFDHVTVLTHADLEVMQRKGVKRVSVLHNPLFLTPSAESIPQKEKVVLAVGRLDIWHCKGFDLLVEAWNNVAPLHPDWRLKIVGKGSEKSLTLLKSLSLHPETIEFVPFTPHPEALYEQASIYVLSSRYEGWGLVMVEAMSRGCATVACDHKGRQAEVITDGETGLLCPTNDAAAIADRINRLIENPELRLQLQQAATQRAQCFSQELTAQRLAALIGSLTTNAK